MSIEIDAFIQKKKELEAEKEELQDKIIAINQKLSEISSIIKRFNNNSLREMSSDEIRHFFGDN